MAQADTIDRESAERQFSELLEMRARIGRMTGAAAASRPAITLGSAYDDAAPIVQRRWDTLAAEVSAWAAAGAGALAAGNARRPHAAAARLADELDQAIDGLNRLLRL